MPILQDVSNNLTSHTDRNPDMGCTWELVAMPGHDKDLGILSPMALFGFLQSPPRPHGQILDEAGG